MRAACGSTSITATVLAPFLEMGGNGQVEVGQRFTRPRLFALQCDCKHVFILHMSIFRLVDLYTCTKIHASTVGKLDKMLWPGKEGSEARAGRTAAAPRILYYSTCGPSALYTCI